MADGTTHSSGCFNWGSRHYECALNEMARLRAEIERKNAALRPFADRVFNDNGDITVSHFAPLTYDDFVNAYRAVKPRRAALSTAPTPAESGETRAKIAALDSDDLAAWGWAPGLYLLRCSCVPADAKPIDWPMGAKRSARCEPCARKAKEVFRATAMLAAAKEGK